MTLKRRARNRLLMLLAGLVLIGAMGGGLLYYRDIRAQNKFADFRARGMAAAAAGNDAAVVIFLGQYLRRYPADIEAMGTYVKSRPKVVDPGAQPGANLVETATLLRRLLQLDPDRPEDWRELMKLNFSFQRLTEAYDAAEGLLMHNPNDGEALSVEASSLYSLKKYSMALGQAEKRLALDPRDWSTQIVRLECLKQLGRTPEIILQTAQRVADKFPDEQGGLVVQAIAFELTDDPISTQVKLDRAAHMPVSDPIVGAMLVRLLDLLSMQQDSMDVLKKLAAQGDPSAEKLLLRRLWEQNNFDEVLALYAAASTRPTTAPTDSSAAASAQKTAPLDDSESLGLYAETLRKRHHDSNYTGVLAKLQGRTDDVLAAAWTAIIQDYPVNDRDKAAALRAACTDALMHYPQDPYLYYFKAAAAAYSGEQNAAIDLWGQAAQCSITWAMPLVDRAQMYLTLNGHLDDALRDSVDAFKRDNSSTAAAVTNAMVLYAKIEAGDDDPKLAGRLNDLIQEVQNKEHSPGEEQTLRIQAALQARAGDSAGAVNTIHVLLKKQPPVDQRLMLSLANISRKYNLGVEDDCVATVEKDYGRTPESAITLALGDYTQHKGDQGVKLLQDCVASAKGSQLIGFRLALASYLDATGDKDALQTWVALGDQYPQELNVQRAALASTAAADDRDFVSRTIDRLHSLLGDDDNTWKIARAKWLLDAPASDKNTADALALLQDVQRRDANSLGGNILLGLAEARAGDLTKAANYFKVAEKLDPNAHELKKDYARLLQYRGDFDDARRQLEQAAALEKSPDQLTETAMLLASQGDVDGAVNILQPVVAGPNATEKQKLILLSLYSRTKQFDKAQALSDAMLRDNPDAPTLVTSAQLDMFQRRPVDADAKLARLKTLTWKPGEYEQVMGDFHYSFGLLPQALAEYHAAATAAPTVVIHWMSLLDCQAAMGLISDMGPTANDALKQLPTDQQAPVLAVQTQIPLMLKAGFGPTQKQLFTSIVQDPTPNDPPVTTLTTMVQLAESDDTPDEVLQGLSRLSLSLPKFLPAQTALIEAQLRLGRAEDAVQSATRTVASFPNEYYPAKLGVDAFNSLQRYGEALDMAQKWKERVVGDATDVDLKISQIQLNMGNPAAAVATVTPHLNEPYLTPDQKWQMQIVQAKALVTQGQPRQAVDSLWPTVASWDTLDAESQPDLRALHERGVLSGFLDFAVSNLPADQAAQQLNHVSDWLKTQKNPQSCQIALAVQWDYLGLKSKNKTYSKTAADLLTTLTQDPDADIASSAAGTLGQQDEENGDSAAAEASYRLAISKAALLKKDYPDAQNNLAMLLADHGGDLKEAAELAQKCITPNPNSAATAPFYDTLAHVQDKAKNFAAAAAAMQTASRLQPSNARWHVNLAAMQIEAGQRDLAKQTLAELAVMSPGVNSLPREYRARLDALNAQLSLATPAPTTRPVQ